MPRAECSFQSWLSQEPERRATFLASIPMAKVQILGALEAAGVTVLSVNYDGYGDSGQMNDFNATLTDGSTVALADLPSSASPIADNTSDNEADEPVTLADAIERFCCDLVEAHHDDYENNEGGNGEFTFDVAAGTVTLVHNDVIIEHDTTIHEL